MDLSIIIVTHNSLVPVGKCLSLLEKHPPSCEYETIVIDNASSDGTPGMIASGYEQCALVVNDDNRGYSRGVNQGIDLSDSEMILILNPDIEVREGSIDRLLEFMKDNPDAGMAGSKLFYPDGTLQYSCRSFYTVSTLFLRRTLLGRLFPRARVLKKHLMTDYDHDLSRKVDWLIGACLMVRREAVRKVGKMDERFFLYFEDTDWCFRMHHHGWGVYYVPDSVMIHNYERSSAKSMFKKPFLLHLLSLFRYYEKWNVFFYFFRRHRGAIKSFVFALADFVAINAGFLAAYYLREYMQSFFTYGLYPLDWYTFFILFYNCIFFMAFLFGGLYGIHRETGAALEFSRVARSVFVTFAILLGATYLARIRIYSRAVLGAQAIFTLVLVFGLRRMIRMFHRQLVRASFDLKRVVLAGNEIEVAEFNDLAMSDPGFGIDIVGHISERPDSLGPVTRLDEIIEKFRIQEIIILPSHLEQGSVLPFLSGSGRRMLEIKIVSPAARFIGRGVRVERLGSKYIFSIEHGAQFLFLRAFQRVCDVLAALVVIPFSVLFSGFYRIIAGRKGKMRFFSEERIGYLGKLFAWPRTVKSSGTEAADIFKTRIWLDLLAGKVSLVGPPPLLPSWHMDDGRMPQRVKPGITGLWRILPSDGWVSAVEDEIIESRLRSVTDYLEILFRSPGICKSGIYPGWFFNKGE